MKRFVDDAPFVYLAADAAGIIRDLNPRACRRLGYEAEELLGQPFEKVCTLATRIFLQTHLLPLVRIQGWADEIFISLKCKDGNELPLLFNIERSGEGDDHRLNYAGIVVSNRKQFEQELIAARKTAEAALQENSELLAAKKELQAHAEELDLRIQQATESTAELEQFNRVVTHDVQEPLRKLSIFSNLLIEDSTREDAGAIIQKICRVTMQLRDIIHGLQQYVWLNDRPLRLRTVDPTSLLALVQQQLEAKFTGLSFEIRKKNLHEFTGDGEQMQVLLYELLANALLFRTEDEKAVVEIQMEDLQQNQFRQTEGRYKWINCVRIEVRDNGIGFDQQFAEQSFGLFRRLHPQSGRGVGLALCRKIAANHAGQISIDSTPGRGTTVRLILPAEPNATPIISPQGNLENNAYETEEKDIAGR